MARACASVSRVRSMAWHSKEADLRGTDQMGVGHQVVCEVKEEMGCIKISCCMV